MLKRAIVCSLIMSIVATCLGCSSILEGDTRSESPHTAVSNERPQEARIEVSNYEELKARILDFVMRHEGQGLMVVHRYGGDVETDVDRAIDEIMSDNPRAVYAVAEIDGIVTRIVSYFEIDINIEYKRTKEQLESIIAVSNLRYLRTELLRIMSEYREEAVFLTSLQVTEMDMVGFVIETYYENPRNIVIMPITVVETFTTNGNERLIELRFRYIAEADMMRQYGASLTGSVRRNVLVAEGENDAEILLSLVVNLIGASNFDEATARTISEHGVQNLAATAHNALVTGSAVGEGFAMAFKALCDELGLDCRVVLGYLNGMVHAWNIVSLFGDYYHIDVAMSALNGVETAFLKADVDFNEIYTWDTENTERCIGTLTYEDIVGTGDDEDNEEDDEQHDGTDAEISDDPDNGADAGTSGVSDEV